MTPVPPAPEQGEREVDPTKAMWAIAYASVKRTRDLGPALRRAYRKGEYPPDEKALLDARQWARSIYLALNEACKLAGVGALQEGEET